ncbi:AAA family ATPase [Streptomyces lonarensis]|uniref:ATP-binding protein n=1 Tax=Streptomyces lonarensis TaxID=700599 RepID=A0A7X6I0E2_9ACTN|nr:AAA family ATPase [Streptomyces lonarensis]NJQ07663.1 ATP-binding protein [Streptomyces lonarensis]
MSLVPVPGHVRFRDEEWAKLTRFAGHDSGALRIGVVSGRRRLGKSYLLRALCEAMDGTYLLAVQEDSRPAAQARVVEAVARARGLPTEALRLGDDWAAILRLLLQSRPGAGRVPPLLVLDEFPYLLRHSPELPGLLQSLYDEARYESGAGRAALQGGVILCGSALSVMHDLLSGQQALRGRATLDLRLAPLDFRAAREFWGIEDPHTAFLVDAVCGGVPGYRVLAEHDAPHSRTGFDDFAARSLLTPGGPLYSRTETEYLLREDPRLDQRATYYPLLGAMVDGATTPTEIGGRIGKERSATAHALDVLDAAGYVRRDQDLLKKRSPSYLVPDPMIRFNQAVTIPQTPLIDAGLPERAWKQAGPAFQSQVLGPHFEQLAREWTRRWAPDEAPGLDFGWVGRTEVADPTARTRHELDVVLLGPGESPRHAHRTIRMIGEAKATAAPRGIKDLERLDHIRGLLARQGHHTEDAVLALFSLHGFWPDLTVLAARRDDTLLIGLPELYRPSVPAR